MFTYQVQGPNAINVLKTVTDANLREIPFFDFEEIDGGGHDIRALRHGMAGEIGFELQGPHAHADDVRQTLLEAGESEDPRTRNEGRTSR